MTDCHGEFRTWGCLCPHCKDRMHPMDRIARFTPEQLTGWAQRQQEIYAEYEMRPREWCIYCEHPGRRYAGGRFCDKHVPGRNR